MSIACDNYVINNVLLVFPNKNKKQIPNLNFALLFIYQGTNWFSRNNLSSFYFLNTDFFYPISDSATDLKFFNHKSR